ncbi:hypothetical protein KFK09_028057 [Dendrobium nobile]|uniref:Uncharacterized protein n=1 Tax=Dendrobium nobile TaxID=94219 RepID=A0A8T3A2I2_DENNO|nr:hypothetical protein KFK09_028057 [Dendrobium nobile]
MFWPRHYEMNRNTGFRGKSRITRAGNRGSSTCFDFADLSLTSRSHQACCSCLCGSSASHNSYPFVYSLEGNRINKI